MSNRFTQTLVKYFMTYTYTGIFILQIKSVKWIEIHENYNGRFKPNHHDVAIVRLDFEKNKKKITNGLKHVPNYVEPACLPKGNNH